MSEIYNIVDKKKLDVVKKTISKSRIGISKGLDKQWNFSFNM